MRAARVSLISLMALAVVAVLSCGKGTPTAPGGAKLTVTASPPAISATGTSTIMVLATRSSGLPVNPGTEISLFTTLGTITSVVKTDDNGLATGTLQATGQQGTAHVTASSGGTVSTAVDVTIGQKATLLALDATPSVIDPTATSDVRLTAVVLDDQGNRIPNVLVLFSTTSGSLRSRGIGVRTNASGIATDTLTVTPNDVINVSSITVTAQAISGGATVTQTKTITVAAPPTPTPTPTP